MYYIQYYQDMKCFIFNTSWTGSVSCPILSCSLLPRYQMFHVPYFLDIKCFMFPTS